MKKINRGYLRLFTYGDTVSSARGFTIIELLIVVAIIGIMSAIAIPNFSNMISKSRLRAASSDLMQEVQITKLRAIGRNQTCGLIVLTNAGSPGGGYLVCCSGDPPAYASGSLTNEQAVSKFYYRQLGGKYARPINIQSISGVDTFTTSAYCPSDVITALGLASEVSGILVNNFGRVINLSAAQAEISLRRYAGVAAKGQRVVAVGEQATAALGGESQP